MAFLLPLEFDNTGVAAAYWRVTHVQMDRNAGITEVTLHGFRDEAARHAGKAPLHRLAFRLAFPLGRDATPSPDRLAMDEIYQAIRAVPGPDGAAPLFATADDI